MSAVLARSLAVATLVLTTLLAALGQILAVVFADAEVANRLGLPFGFLLPIVYGLVGALIVVRQRHNTVGWLLLLLGLVAATLVLTEIYEPIAKANPGAPVGLATQETISDLTWVAFFPLLCLILQLFPAGRSLTPRWRYLAWSTWLWILVGVVLAPLSADPGSTPPLLLAWWLALIVMSVVSILVRTYRASGAERQQIKWLAFGAFPGLIVIPAAATESPEIFPLQMIGFMWVPVTIGIAVLRYRLYDIDRLVNRAAVYATVSVLLAAIYGASVLLLTFLLSQIAGGDALAVAGSTLTAAALFQPVRSIVQGFVDRRFDRAKYDGARTVADFGTQLRDEVDLDSVLADLQGVITATIGPSSASVWLRPSRGGVRR